MHAFGFLTGACVLPFLFVLRFIIDDLSNIQINSFILLSCLYAIHCYLHERHITAGIILGIIISLKVYPIFLLFFFVYKRAYKTTAISLLIIGLTTLISLLIFGWDVGVQYYTDWIQNKAMGETILTHKNQSIFPWFEGLLTDQSRGLDIRYNVLSLTAAWSKKITYIVIGSAALYIAWLFRKGNSRYSVVGQFGLCIGWYSYFVATCMEILFCVFISFTFHSIQLFATNAHQRSHSLTLYRLNRARYFVYRRIIGCVVLPMC